MRIEEFQKKMADALGRTLENATPANVREFVDQVQLELWREGHPIPAKGMAASPIEISGDVPMSYEAVMRAFFVKALIADREQSLIQLWLLSLDLAYSGIEEMHSEQMRRLFNADLE